MEGIAGELDSSQQGVVQGAHPRIPLAGLALTFVVGIWCGLDWGVDGSQWFAAAFIAWLSACLCFVLCRGKAAASAYSKAVQFLIIAGLHTILFLSAIAFASLRTSDVRMIQPLFAGIVNSDITLTGIVAGDPEALVSRDGRSSVSFPIKVETISYGTGEVSVAGIKMPVFLRAGSKDVKPGYGERWVLPGQWKEFRNSGRPDVQTDQAGRIRWFYQADARFARCLSSGHGIPWFGTLYSLREKTARYLEVGIEDELVVVAISRALVLGYRGEIPADLKQDFITSGTLHIFAISGLHVVVIAAFLVFILNTLGVSRVYWALITLPVIGGYTIATGASASAVRACLMGAICLASVLIGRRANALLALALSAMILLIVDPFQLRDAGFLLSYGVTLGIILLYPVLRDSMKSMWQADPFQVQAEPKFIIWRRAMIEAVLSTCNVSVVSWLVSAPLLMYLFGRVSLIALLTNLIVVPLSTLVLLCGCVSLAVGVCADTAAMVFNHATWALDKLLFYIVQESSKLPFASLETGFPEGRFVALYYLALALFALLLRMRNIRSASALAGKM